MSGVTRACQRRVRRRMFSPTLVQRSGPLADSWCTTLLAGWYTTAWFDCWVKGQASACVRARAPLPHLSKSFASEQDADGPIGPKPSRCIVVPTEASMNMTPQEFASAEGGRPVYNCKL